MYLERVGIRNESKRCYQTSEGFRRGNEPLKENLAMERSDYRFKGPCFIGRERNEEREIN